MKYYVDNSKNINKICLVMAWHVASVMFYGVGLVQKPLLRCSYIEVGGSVKIL